jgi:hypothetical protein
VRDLGIGQPINSEECSETAEGVARESEGRSRLSLLRPYDKISREDILAHAYAQCRSNKGAPGVDGQDFVDIEAYGVQRWLGELALALRQETYRPNPIRRVFIPKANGKLRPLGISNGDVLPPLGFAATLPNRTNRCIHRTAELTLTSNRSAASCRDAPASTHSTNGVRRSKE